MDEARESGSIGFEALKIHLLKQTESRASVARSFRKSRDHGVVGDEISRRHCIEDLLGVAEGDALGVECKEVVAQEWGRGWWHGNEDEGVELASFPKGVRRGASLEERRCY